MKYSYKVLKLHIDLFKTNYPFIEVDSIGKSILGRNIPYIKIGNGKKEVFYSASYHANEWITTPVLMKFVADYCYAYQNNLTLFGYNAQELYNSYTLYIVPMVNPDGVVLIFIGIIYAIFMSSSISTSSFMYLAISFNLLKAK